MKLQNGQVLKENNCCSWLDVCALYLCISSITPGGGSVCALYLCISSITPGGGSVCSVPVYI